MDGNINNYIRIQNAIIVGFVLVVLLLVSTSLTTVENFLICSVGEYSFYLMKIAPWGGFGAIMRASFLAASDKQANHTRKLAYEKDPTTDPPNYPDSNDVVMYFFYCLSGLVLAALSAFLLETGIDHVNADNAFPIKERFGLFAIFAFYAGHSQSEIVGRLNRIASRQK